MGWKDHVTRKGSGNEGRIRLVGKDQVMREGSGWEGRIRLGGKNQVGRNKKWFLKIKNK